MCSNSTKLLDILRESACFFSVLLSHSIGQQLSLFHGELILDVRHILIVNDTPTANVEGQHESHKESVVGHDRHRPQDDEGTEEDRVTAVLEKLLLLA